jgi:cGMP-dependent protein kinase 1
VPIIDIRRNSNAQSDAPTAVVTDKSKTKKDIELINIALNKHFIFTSLSENNRNLLIDRMKHYSLTSNQIVFEQNQTGNNFFIVITGKLDVIVNGNKVNTLVRRDSFGELALLHNTPRSATIIAIEETTLWGLDRKTFRKALETVNAQNYLENQQFIEIVPLFKILTSSQKDALVGSLSTLKFRVGEKVVNEGDPGDLFYIIKEGTVSCTQKGKLIRQMFKGDFFGEQALLYNSVRTATITATTDLKCVAIGRERLTKVLGNQLQHILYHNTKKIIIERSEVLSRLNPYQVDKALENLHVQTFQKGEVIIPQSTLKGSKMWMVLKCNVIDKNNKIIAEVFSCIGDSDIIKPLDGQYYEEAFSGNECAVAFMTREIFLYCMGGDFTQATSNNEAYGILRKAQLFKNLTADRYQALTSALQLRSFNNGDIIVQQNSIGDSFFIIRSGKVDIIRNGVNIRTITKNDYFGERSILNTEPRTATVIANGEVTCWVLSTSDFLAVVDENIISILRNRIQLQDDNITLNQLSIIKILGKGMFGNVFLAIKKENKNLYALKTIERKKIERYGIHENLILERKVLLQLDHIFILKLVKTFKDAKRIYFLTEFVRGMDLFDVIRELNLMSDDDSKFYVACMILILEYLHDRDIIYRDLKPENVIVDQAGYLKLIDFGTSKFVDGRTFTVVGTPHYMAPEVIIGKGYGVTADFWSLGIMLYEFMCGGVPFGENEEDPYLIYEKVLEQRLLYPSFVDSTFPAKKFIEQLLNKNPNLRTGGSVDNLKNHRWLSDINWVYYI